MNNKTLLWILVGVGILLLGGGIVTAILFGKFVGKTASEVGQLSNSQANSQEQESATSADGSGEIIDGDLDKFEYILAALPVLQGIEDALNSWQAGAELGGEDGQTAASTEKFREALQSIEEAQKIYETLQPTSEVEQLHELGGQALQQARQAMELAIKANEEQDDASVEASINTIEELIGTLEAIEKELENFDQPES